jgi:heme/copper-type cytochrome/quinol oxidase subunit 4
MWGTVLLMAVVTGIDPVRIGAVAFILTRTSPLRLLLGYLIGGFGLSLIIGVVVVFVLKDINIGKSSSVPPEIEVAVGAFALLVAVLVGTSASAQIRDRAQHRHPESNIPNLDQPAHPEGPPGIESMPGFDKLPNRVKAALSKESPWVAWVAGLATGLPAAYYLAAIAAILKSGSSAGVQVAALIVFNVVAFMQAVVPLVAFLFAPEATRHRVEQLYHWVSFHQRVVVTALAGIVGIYLVIVGASKL